MNLLKKSLLANLIILSSFNSNAQNQENNRNHKNILPLINYLDARGFKIDSLLKELIASVIGIESEFGEIEGEYNPFNVYVSLYVKDYKKEFAKTHLKELLILCKKNNLDVFNLRSSYAGAISYGQFLPSSLNLWFIGNDLCSMDNNIFSVANYLYDFNNQYLQRETSLSGICKTN